MIKQNDPRRWQERADARMIQEDHSAVANLPETVINREIPHHDLTYGPVSSIAELHMAFFDGVKGKR